MPLGDHSNKRVEPVDVAVDRLEPGGEGRAPHRGHDFLLGLRAAGSDEVPFRVSELDEVEDVRVIDWILCVDQRIRRETLGGLAGDVDERGLRREAIRAAQVVVRRQSMFAAAGAVDRAGAAYPGEAVGGGERHPTDRGSVCARRAEMAENDWGGG